MCAQFQRKTEDGHGMSVEQYSYLCTVARNELTIFIEIRINKAITLRLPDEIMPIQFYSKWNGNGANGISKESNRLFFISLWQFGCVWRVRFGHTYIWHLTHLPLQTSHTIRFTAFFLSPAFFVWVKCIQSRSPLRSSEPEQEKDRWTGRHWCECVDEWNKNVCT